MSGMGLERFVQNPELIAIAQQAVRGLSKRAFIPSGPGGGMDPAAGGGAPPAGGDPATMGMGGMDPSMMAPPAGGDAGGGGAPAGPGGGPAGDPVQQQILQLLQQLVNGGGGAGGAAGAGAGLKPKIDINVAVMQMSKMLARICDQMGINIPAHEMIATPQDLGAMAQQQQTGAPGSMPDGGGGAGGGAQSYVPPLGALQGMQPVGGGGGGEKTGQARPENGWPVALPPLHSTAEAIGMQGDRVAAVAFLLGQRRA